MTPRAVAVGVAALGAGYALWRLPATRRFVATVGEAARQREADLREAVEVAVRADATTRAPRHAAGSTVPDLEVDAGWDGDRGEPRGAATALTDADPGRSLTPQEAHDLLLDPSGEGRAGGRAR
ncbi:hypothetical protein JQN72_05655 [Phycicoccus sp. CSK15P-2]|uniref:hypothetical protein n=1 Tax=Phycicoccus sp. CSK15P-2 TaxID=2807627 RepID=UPI001950A3D6|nr:hypothetical protein [Phycicoccus sp. CSK15P-2]MBM6403725.1 hypothetical protein [Phycicoccus sp. CSK15P-2]